MGGRGGLIVAGVIVIVIGAAMLIGGGIALGLGAVFDGEESRTVRTDGHAVLVGDVSGSQFSLGGTSYEGDFEIRVSAEAEAGRNVFVGVARAQDVAEYLRGVPWAVDPLFSGGTVFGSGVAERGAPAPPIRQDFWAESASGAGVQTIGWNVRPGTWAVVVMRPSGESPVAADVTAKVRVPVLDTITDRMGPWVPLVGAFLIVDGIILVVLGARRGRRRPPPGPREAPIDAPVNPVGRF